MKNILGIAKMLNRHGLTALFLAFIALLGLWNLPAAGQTGQEALSPEPSAQEDGSRGGGFLDAWDRLVDALDTFYLEDLRGRYGFIEGNGLVKRLAGFSTCNETVRLANGYLERLDNNFDVEDTAESLTALNEYCRELGGSFYSLDQWDTRDLPIYEESGVPTAIKAEETGLAKYLNNETGEALLLVFPDTGQHQEACGAFLQFLQEEKDVDITGA